MIRLFGTALLAPALGRSLAQTGLGFALPSTLLLALGLLAGWAGRRRGPALPALIYQVTLIAALLGGLLSVALAGRLPTPWHVSPPAAHPPAVAPPLSADPAAWPARQDAGDGPLRTTDFAPGSPPLRSGPGASETAPSAALAPKSAPPPGADRWIETATVGIWATGALALLGWLLLCQFHLGRLRRESVPASDEATAALAELCGTMRLRVPRLRSSPRAASPLLTGLRQPVILLPAACEAELDTPALRAILTHELVHLARWDCAWNLLARLSCGLCWPQPLFWLLAYRLRQASEEVCDQEVVRMEGDPRAYARCLFTLSERLLPSGRERVLGVGVVPFRTALGRRIARILAGSPSHPLSPRGRGAVLLGAAAAVALALLLLPTGAAVSPAVSDAPAGGKQGGQPHRSPLAGVPELAKPVTFAETKIPLSELVQKVSVETGVPLTAAREVADEPVALAVTAMPARELLQQLADLLDYQWHRLPGSRRPDTDHPTPTYEIYQDLASKQREEALREARVTEVVRRFEAQLKTYEAIAALSPEAFQHLDDQARSYWESWWKLSPEQQAARLNQPGTKELQEGYRAAGRLRAPIPRTLAALLGPLSSAQWTRLLDGSTITWSSDPKSGELRLPLDLERRLRGATPTWLAPGARLAYPEPGDDERLRQRDQALQEAWSAASGYRVTLRLDTRQLQTRAWLTLNANAAPFRSGAPLNADLPPAGPASGASLTIFSGESSALPPAEEDTSQRRAALENDPVLGVKRALETAVKPQPNPDGPMAPARWSLWELLPDFARTYQVDFIADSYWSSTPGLGAIPREPTALFALLDRAAGPTHRWERRGKLIRLRSRTWFLDRPREIPLRYVRRWKALMAQRGALPLETYLELVTTLTDAQIDSLLRLVEIAGLPHDLDAATFGRDLLRLYTSLLPSQQEALRQGKALPLSRMTPRQQALFLATLKRLRGAAPGELTAEQLAGANLSLKQVPMIRTIDRRHGGDTVSDQPAAATSPAPGPAPAPPGVERIPVTQLQFWLADGQRERGVGLVTAPSP